jgi:hypothetical protein
MSTDLEQLFRDSTSTAPTSRIDLDTVVRRGRTARRRHQVRAAATVGVTGAIVVGVGALATSGHVATGSSAAAGGSSAPGPVSVTVTASANAPRPTPSDGTASAVATPAPPDTTVGPKPVASDAPADLRAVALPDPAPGFGPRRFPDSVALTENLNLVTGPFWTATFGVGDESGTGKQATVFVGAFPMPATSGTPTLGASPGPITDTPTVAGHQAYVTHDGSQTILYFRTARFTVQVCGLNATIEDLVTLAESLRGIE